MKMLMFFAAVAMLTASTLGCKCTNCFSRGASCPACGQQPACPPDGCYMGQDGAMGVPAETFAPGPA